MRFPCNFLPVGPAIGRRSSQLYRNYCLLRVVFALVLLGIHLAYYTNQYLRCVDRSKIAENINMCGI